MTIGVIWLRLSRQSSPPVSSPVAVKVERQNLLSRTFAAVFRLLICPANGPWEVLQFPNAWSVWGTPRFRTNYSTRNRNSRTDGAATGAQNIPWHQREDGLQLPTLGRYSKNEDGAMLA